jgi:uncharacterized damage-inducible protein DinB
MDRLAHLNRLLAYDDWANREALGSLRAAASPPPGSLRILAHIVACEWLWLGRLKQDGKPVVVWPEKTLAQCETELAELRGLWTDYLEKLKPENREERIPYLNSKGESWASKVEDMLLHLVIHSAYHRGQIASDVRASGHTPAYTDFIHCIREGFVR